MSALTLAHIDNMPVFALLDRPERREPAITLADKAFAFLRKLDSEKMFEQAAISESDFEERTLRLFARQIYLDRLIHNLRISRL